MYAGDSFFILSAAGQAGLAALSTLLAVAAGACVLAFTGPGVRLVAALAVQGVFPGLAPQSY